MTKEEMLERYYQGCFENNYKEAQRRIKEAMLKGRKYVLLPGKHNNIGEFAWAALPETIEQLREDGFDIDVVWDPYEYWSVEWLNI